VCGERPKALGRSRRRSAWKWRSDHQVPQRGIDPQPNVAPKTFGATLGYQSNQLGNLNEVVAVCVRKWK
jgi:hypothetical protein